MRVYYIKQGVRDGLAVVCWTAKCEVWPSKVQSPARTEIWIEISVPWAPLLLTGITSQCITELVPSLKLSSARKWGSSEWVQIPR